METEASSLAASEILSKKDSGKNFLGESGLSEAEQKSYVEEIADKPISSAIEDTIVNYRNHIIKLEREKEEEKDVVSTSESEADGSYDEEDSESEENSTEYYLVLDDAKNLKMLAIAFLHPERPVEVDPTSMARCYFNRISAVDQESAEEAEVRAQVVADCMALKKLAIDYAHPERPVEVDPTSMARCYFNRISAVDQESVEEAKVRAQVVADCMALKKLAIDYAHPERPVEVDPTSMARCYFTRISASVVEPDCFVQSCIVAENVENTQQYSSSPFVPKTMSHYEAPDVVINRSPSSVLLFGLDSDFNGF